MVLRERERARDFDDYDRQIARDREKMDRARYGKVVIRGKDVPWVQSRQARTKMYMKPSRASGVPVETVLDDWRVFVQDIRVHSGKHRHQGGLVIYVIEGEGSTEVDGERHDWQAGDLLLLPLKPGGVVHQHFNKNDDKPAKWIAFIYYQIREWTASRIEQIEEHPEFRKDHE
jgi:mannose-6-phosphate isomerase-like protein (cupin superfamily)